MTWSQCNLICLAFDAEFILRSYDKRRMVYFSWFYVLLLWISSNSHTFHCILYSSSTRWFSQYTKTRLTLKLYLLRKWFKCKRSNGFSLLIFRHLRSSWAWWFSFANITLSYFQILSIILSNKRTFKAIDGIWKDYNWEKD